MFRKKLSKGATKVAQEELVEWIEEKMQELGWKPADLARESGLRPATLSHILNEDRPAGARACIQIAIAFGEAPETTLRIAGILPPVHDDRKEVKDLIDYLEPEEYQVVFDYIRWRIQQQRQRKRKK